MTAVMSAFSHLSDVNLNEPDWSNGEKAVASLSHSTSDPAYLSPPNPTPPVLPDLRLGEDFESLILGRDENPKVESVAPITNKLYISAKTFPLPNIPRREPSQKRPLSVAVGFTLGGPSEDSPTDSSPDGVTDTIKARRLSFNGHQEDHLAALQTLARNSPTPGPDGSLVISTYSGGPLVEEPREELRGADAPYQGPIVLKELDPASCNVEARKGSTAILELESGSQPMDQRALKRIMIVNELLETERMYVNDLRTLVESFFDRLEPLSWLPNDKKFSLMRNASELYKFQQEFLTYLESAVENAKQRGIDIGIPMSQVFIDFQDRFQVYSQYCTHHDQALKILGEYEKRPEMVTFLKDFRGLAQTKLDVKDYLIKPVQRLCRYPLLLNEIMKNTEVDSECFNALFAAHCVMQNVALEIDSAKWRLENMERTDRFFARLENAPADLPTRLEVGDLILSAALCVVNYDQYASKLRYRGVFLFPDYLFVVKPRRMTAYSLKLCLALSACEFRQLGTGESLLPNAWRLTVGDGGQHYDFSAPDNKNCILWTDVLSRLVPSVKKRADDVYPSPTASTGDDPQMDGSIKMVDSAENLRRASSATSLNTISDHSTSITQERSRSRSGQRAGFQRKKERHFWRQSSVDLSQETFSIGMGSSSGPHSQIAMLISDVLTPSSDAVGTVSLPATKSVPDLRGYVLVDVAAVNKRTASTPTLPTNKKYTLSVRTSPLPSSLLPSRGWSDTAMSRNIPDSPSSHQSLERLSEESVVGEQDMLKGLGLKASDENTVVGGRTSPDSKRPNHTQNGADNTRTSQSRKSCHVDDAREVFSGGLHLPPRASTFSSSAPLLNRHPSRTSVSSWISDRSDRSIPPVPPMPSPRSAPRPNGFGTVGTGYGGESNGTARQKQRRNNLVRRTLSQLFQGGGKGLKGAFGIGKGGEK